MKYVVPKEKDFFVGFEYEEFETIVLDKYKDRNGNIVLPGFTTYSDEYFKELHSNDKYWQHRKWVKKIANNSTVFLLSSTYDKEQYTPLNIKNIFRVSKESLLQQWQQRVEEIKLI